jgi:hypothetical protein
MIRAANLGLRFLLELALLAALAYWGTTVGDSTLAGVACAVAAPAAAALVWGLALSPKARVALPPRPKALLQVLVLAVGAVALAAAGQVAAALVLAAAVAVNAVLLELLRQP